MLPYKPNKHMAVEDHVLKFKVLLVFILVDEGSLEFAFLAHIELLHLYLLGEVHAVLRHPLEYSLLGAPVYGQLFVSLLLLEVVDLVLRKSLLFND